MHSQQIIKFCVLRVTKMGRGTLLRILPLCPLSVLYSLTVCMTHIYGTLCEHSASGDNTVERSGMQPAKDFFIPHFLVLFLASNQPYTETSTCQHTTFTRDKIHATGGIRTRNSSKRAPADTRLRPRGHRDRLVKDSLNQKVYSLLT
jgi:hypothetical protein